MARNFRRGWGLSKKSIGCGAVKWGEKKAPHAMRGFLIVFVVRCGLQREVAVEGVVAAGALPAVVEVFGFIGGLVGEANFAVLNGEQRLVPDQVGLDAAAAVAHGFDINRGEAFRIDDVGAFLV